MDLIFIYEKIGVVVPVAVLAYLILFWIFKKGIVSFSDPFNLELLMFAAYLSGAIVLGFSFDVNTTYYAALLLMATYLATGAVVLGRRTQPQSCPSLDAPRSVQYFFAVGVTSALALNLVANYIFGFIPLLHGTQSRAEAGNVPIASLMVFQPVLLSIALYTLLFTNWIEVKIMSGIGLALGVVVFILSGSKSAIFVVISCLFSLDYVLRWKLRGESAPLVRKRTVRLIRRTKVLLVVGAVATAVFFPVYLLAIGAGDDIESSLILIVARAFGGFDGLVAIVQSGIDFHSTEKLDLLPMYFYPFYAKLGIPPHFKTIGSYIIYLTFGDYDDATSSLYPNSNFALELLFCFTSVAAMFVTIVLAAAAVFYVRRRVLAVKSWGMIHIFLFAFVVTSPISLLIDGAYSINLFYSEVFFYLLLNTILNLLRKPAGRGLVYTLY